jgi:hypothetical protein
MNWHLRFLPTCGIVFVLAALCVDAKPSGKEGKDGKDGKETKSDPPASYYPLQVGNQWNYRVEVGGSSAQAVSRISKIETIDGVPLARLEATVNGTIVATEHLRATKEGVFRHRNNGQEISPPLCLIKYPVKAGESWEGDITVGKEKGKYACSTREENNVEVTAGKFKAIKVTITLDSKMQKVTTSYWFVKDIGFVKQTVEAGDLNITMELEKFEAASKDTSK